MGKLRLTTAMRRVLENLAAGVEAGVHLKTQAAQGGFHGTARALCVRGLMTWDYEITPAGLAAIGKERERPS